MKYFYSPFRYVDFGYISFAAYVDIINNVYLIGSNGRIQIYNLSWELLTTITISIDPRYILHDSVNDRYLVSGNSSNILVIDSVTYTVSNLLTPLFVLNPRAMWIDYNTNELYICDLTHDRVVSVDLTTTLQVNEILITQPTDLYCDVANDKLYIVKSTLNAIDVYEYSTLTYITTISSLTSAYGITQYEDKIIVSHAVANGYLRILDINTYLTIGTVQGLVLPRFMFFHNNLLHVTNNSNTKLLISNKPF